MKSKRLRFFSMLMAVMMFTTSVGITVKVHYCLMDIQQKMTVQKESNCCATECPESCCETNRELSFADGVVNDKDCCKDEIKSFALPIAFVNKIVAVQLNQFITLLHFVISHRIASADVFEQNYFSVISIFSPPKISGTTLLCFKSVLNL